jgi:hypothetical protein
MRMTQKSQHGGTGAKFLVTKGYLQAFTGPTKEAAFDKSTYLLQRVREEQ